MTRQPGLWICLVTILALSISLLACSQPSAPAATSAPAAAPAGQSSAPTAAPAAEKKVEYPTKPITFIAPSKPGSGFDTTARAIVTCLEKEKLVPVPLPVQNFSSSAEGNINIVQEHKNDPNMVAINSAGLMTNTAMGRIPTSYKDITLIANLIDSYYGWVVRADSPYKDVKELLKDLKEKPAETPIVGGSDDDRIAAAVSIYTYGGDLKKINYAVYAGGTESSTALLEGSAKAQMTTVDDIMGLIEAKKVRVLAVSGDKRVAGALADVPTFKEAGHDLVWTNFRYLIAGPEMPDYAVKYWKDTMAKMVKTPTWKEMVNKYRWGENFFVDGLDKFFEEKQNMVDKVVTEVGMKQ